MISRRLLLGVVGVVMLVGCSHTTTPPQTTPTQSTFPVGNPAAAYGVLAVMENVAEVFSKGTTWKP